MLKSNKTQIILVFFFFTFIAAKIYTRILHIYTIYKENMGLCADFLLFQLYH